MKLSRFSDGEMFCRIAENVRGSHTFIIQPTSAPANDTLMELLILVRRAASRIGCVDNRGVAVLWVRAPRS